MKKIWCVNINNETNFHKRKISAPRIEQSQALVAFSVRVRIVCSELLSSLLMTYYTFPCIENSPITQWTRTPDQTICSSWRANPLHKRTLTHYTSGRTQWLSICC